MRSFSTFSCVALLWVSATATLAADNPTVGPEFQINTHTTLGQLRPAVAGDGAGNFVVVWDSYAQDGSTRGVFGQLFDSAGAPVGAEFAANSYTTGGQFSPAVAAAPAGDFLVTWQSAEQDGSGTGVFGQLFDAAGAPVGAELLINTHTTAGQFRSDLASDGAGNFIVVWDSAGQDGEGQGVFGQRFDAAGSPVGAEFQINTYTTDDQFNAAVATDAAGNFVVVWSSYTQDGSGRGIFGQLFDSSATPQGAEFQVNTYTTDGQFDSSVAVDGAGNFVVAWSSADQDGDGTGIFAQRFDATGAPVDDEFQVNLYTTADQLKARVSADADGDFVVTWDSYGQDHSGRGVFARRFGELVGEFQVNTEATDDQYGPGVAVDSATGAFVIVWQSLGGQDGEFGGIFGQRYENPDLFEDGFESGDTSAWALVVP